MHSWCITRAVHVVVTTIVLSRGRNHQCNVYFHQQRPAAVAKLSVMSQLSVRLCRSLCCAQSSSIVKGRCCLPFRYCYGWRGSPGPPGCLRIPWLGWWHHHAGVFLLGQVRCVGGWQSSHLINLTPASHFCLSYR